MKKAIIAAAALAVTLSAGAAIGTKRGVCAKPSRTDELEVLKRGSSWFYNWGNSCGLPTVEGVEFVPMCWGNFNAESVRSYCKAHPEVKYLLGFNEPNFKAQSNMTPAEAAERWPEVKALADELGLKLVAPALNYSPDAPYQQPTKWMDEFVAIVGLDAFDYTAIHCYGGAGLIQSMTDEFYEKYGKLVWLTEFCQWPGGAGNVYVSPESQRQSMVESLKFLEQSDKIFRYSWFMATGDWDNKENRPNYGLVYVDGTISNRVYKLSPQGYVYTYLGTFDQNRYDNVNTWVAAADCADLSGVNFDRIEATAATTDLQSPISATTFNAGSSMTFKFAVRNSGAHRLDLLCAGEGEPVRYDPAVTVTVDGTAVVAERSFTLTGSATEFDTRSIELGDLSAGNHTVTISYTGRPSGLALNAVSLVDPSGIGEIEADGIAGETAPPEYYTIQGARVAEPAVPGIYIVKTGKEVKKVLIHQ